MPPRQSQSRHNRNLKLHRNGNSGEVSSDLKVLEIAEKPSLPPSGTAIALKYPTLGVAAVSAKGTTWGGARNHGDRESQSLTAAQVANLWLAMLHAEKLGLPFTRMVTIHWQAAGVKLEDMAKATGRFTDLLTKTLARHGSATAWVWVHENAEKVSLDKGGHCHLLVHVPACLASRVARLQRGWLRQITGQSYRARAIQSVPIGGRLRLEVTNPELLARNQRAAFQYIMKGTDENTADQFGIERLEPGGRVIGKRCGTSQNIGAEARYG